MHIFWDITRECNLKCVHCYNAPDRAKAPPDIDTQKRINLIDRLSLAYPHSTLHLLGGEPTLISEFETIADAARQQELSLEITTNGTERSNALVPYLQKHFKVVHLSLDGIDADSNDRIRGKGTFESALAFLNEWQSHSRCEQQAALDVSFTLTQASLIQAKEIVQFCLHHSVSSLTVQPVKLLGNAKRSERRFGITPAEYFEFSCALAQYSVGEPLRVQITGGSMRMKKFIKWKYFNDVVLVERGCDAGTGQVRVDSTGQIEACIVANRIPDPPIQFNRKAHNDEDSSTRDSIHSRVARKAKLLHMANATSQPAICQSCEYLRSRACYGGCVVQGTFGPSLLCVHLRTLEMIEQSEGMLTP